jgi:hypothetical protein
MDRLAQVREAIVAAPLDDELTAEDTRLLLDVVSSERPAARVWGEVIAAQLFDAALGQGRN